MWCHKVLSYVTCQWLPWHHEMIKYKVMSVWSGRGTFLRWAFSTYWKGKKANKMTMFARDDRELCKTSHRSRQEMNWFAKLWDVLFEQDWSSNKIVVGFVIDEKQMEDATCLLVYMIYIPWDNKSVYMIYIPRDNKSVLSVSFSSMQVGFSVYTQG